jgi:hypothetical protein
MPLGKPEDFGTAASGLRVNDYCHFCYVDGRFTNPDVSLSEMIDFCTDVLVRRGMAYDTARTLMTDALPMLKRWKQPAGVG